MRWFRSRLLAVIAGGMLIALKTKADTITSQTEQAVVAGGCFWDMQDLIRKIGVISTRVPATPPRVWEAIERERAARAL